MTAQNQITTTLELLEFEWSSPIGIMNLRTPTSIEHLLDNNDDDEHLFSRTPKRKSSILEVSEEPEEPEEPEELEEPEVLEEPEELEELEEPEEPEVPEVLEVPEVPEVPVVPVVPEVPEVPEEQPIKIKTFNCWNLDPQTAANQIKLYMNVINHHFDDQLHPTIFLLQGIGPEFKNKLSVIYHNNIVFYEIFGVNKERIDEFNITYVPDYKDRYCAILWSDTFILAQAITPSYVGELHLGRRTSDWLVLQYVDDRNMQIAIANVWLSPQKHTTKKEKPISILQSILEDAELLNKDFSYKIIVAGTFNMIPDMIRDYFNYIDLRHINADKSTIQYISPKMLEKPSHVDYGLFWGFGHIQEDIIVVGNSYHSMVHYCCR